MELFAFAMRLFKLMANVCLLLAQIVRQLSEELGRDLSSAKNAIKEFIRQE